MLGGLYGQSLALLTDFYQLTMAAAAWKSGMEDREAVFHLLFRRPPFESGFTIAAGLATALEYIRELRFTDDDLRYLRELRADSGEPMFEPAFLDHLRSLELGVDVDAVPEGTVVFPHEPLLRVSGPIVPCMLLETPLLALINFQTLIATKSARVALAAQGEPVLEFGLRRAQGADGALSASRAAYLGGAAGFTKTAILASNDLDELLIESLKAQGAKIGVWGVGTRLVTGYDEPALGGVYKLAAVREPGGAWQRRIKISEQPAKTSTPGILQVRRYTCEGEFRGDQIHDGADGTHSDWR